eukprot:CAMPEP_0119341546 /NCGR_PEP_ID=MMETSP1333-20130426/102653_1 /TAXON_ID=418940 /ORGANISM="Scyphosphaera apsteinii, Strain RCC1455" /LENGTH=472 /DNA_ID=CAMNT_0007353541 /DNA_START=281 /DNA_END=1699 /DNA_ORIENTATION=-
MPKSAAALLLTILTLHTHCCGVGPSWLVIKAWKTHHETDLYKAAAKGDVSSCMRILAAGAALNDGMWLGPLGLLQTESPLAVAISSANFDTARALLASGADPNQMSSVGPLGFAGFSPPLHHLVASLQHARSPNETLSLLDALLNAGAHPDVGARVGFGMLKLEVPLINALQDATDDATSFVATTKLLAAGADANVAAGSLGFVLERETALAFAARRGWRFVQALLDAGADPNRASWSLLPIPLRPVWISLDSDLERDRDPTPSLQVLLEHGAELDYASQGWGTYVANPVSLAASRCWQASQESAEANPVCQLARLLVPPGNLSTSVVMRTWGTVREVWDPATNSTTETSRRLPTSFELCATFLALAFAVLGAVGIALLRHRVQPHRAPHGGANAELPGRRHFQQHQRRWRLWLRAMAFRVLVLVLVAALFGVILICLYGLTAVLWLALNHGPRLLDGIQAVCNYSPPRVAL